MARGKRSRRGLSLVETAIGFIILIPIGLVAIDIVTLFSASQNNEQWSEMAARAAATSGDQKSAEKAAEMALADFTSTPVMQNLTISDVDFDVAHGNVQVVTAMQVKLPVPFPGFSEVTCTASAIQPIVSFPAPR